MRRLLLLMFLLPLAIVAQTSAALIEGGDEQINILLENQLTLPKGLLQKTGPRDVTVLFDVDKQGRPINIECEEKNAVLKKECIRLARMLTYRQQVEPYLRSYVTFKLDPRAYGRLYKQQTRYQVKGVQKPDSSGVIFVRADRSPIYYSNGDEGLIQFLMDNLEYPPLAQQQGLEGTVSLDFVVEPNGYVSNIVVRTGVNGGCNNVAVKLISQTRWQPAVSGDHLVRYRMNYPITFSLKNVTRSAHE